MEITENTKFKRGTKKWILWVWENNGHLSSKEKIHCLLHVVEYNKLLKIFIDENLPL